MTMKRYEEVNIEIVRLSDCDVIKTSGEFNGEDDGFANPFWFNRDNG